MHDFRTHTPVSPLRQAEAYWTALRRGDDIPSRSQIDPRGIENILSQTFILERVAPGICRFRLAGRDVNDMAGMEVRGMPITAFFTPDARKQLSAAMEHMFEGPSIIELDLRTEASRLRGSRDAKMLLLPLRSDLGDVSRALGVFVSEGNPGKSSQRFEINAIEMRAISQSIAGADFKATPRDRSKDAPKPTVNAENNGFAETQARFSPERSILDEARALANRGTLKNRNSAAAEDTPKKKGAHLRLVVSRD